VLELYGELQVSETERIDEVLAVRALHVVAIAYDFFERDHGPDAGKLPPDATREIVEEHEGEPPTAEHEPLLEVHPRLSEDGKRQVSLGKPLSRPLFPGV
jgi:hypothetical protein